MDKTSLEKFKKQLQGLLVELEGMESTSKAAAATVVLDQTSVGRLSRIDAMQGQQMAIATERRRKSKVLQINAALKRIDDDTFGLCLTCGEEIPEGRLDINPASGLCIKCAR